MYTIRTENMFYEKYRLLVVIFKHFGCSMAMVAWEDMERNPVGYTGEGKMSKENIREGWRESMSGIVLHTKLSESNLLYNYALHAHLRLDKLYL